MLELKGITKQYPGGGEIVEALRGIDLQFRKSEFVSILGPSGCGKTTMLNIIGGLDQYTNGDLVIRGVSTKNYKDRDWDTYRNHSIGFVFQTYNLIPHQSVLQNVELALTLSGVSKAERRERAKKALEEVGLSTQLRKKPSEMSGGQMQRVAIARAIVNNPDIVLADEPTGALDTETSVQVMEILKEISKNRLVIMVTHNPELAEKYSTRIIRMLDGKITDDSMPLTEEEVQQEAQSDTAVSEQEASKKSKKPSMSLFTAFGLSLKNLFTKKGRTLLTSFAGSIGIIGIALIYAVSNGMTTYINTVQEDTLSSYPITLESQTIDLGSLMETFIGTAQSSGQHELDAVYQKRMLYDMMNAMNTLETTENDLKAFKTHLENKRSDMSEENVLTEALNGVKYTYNLDMLVYTENVEGDIIRSDSEELIMDVMKETFGMDMTSMIAMGEESGMMTNSSMEMMSSFSMGGPSMILWQEMLSGDNGKLINPLLENQYDVIYGSWPNSYDEIVLVVDSRNEIDDVTLYALGLLSKDEVKKVTEAAINKTELENVERKWSFEDICSTEFRVILNSDCYRYDAVTDTYVDLRETETGLKYLYDNATVLKVSGIIRPSENAVSAMLTGSIGYTGKLTEYVVEQMYESAALKAQLADKDYDIFTGLPFASVFDDMTIEDKAEGFLEYIKALDNTQKAETYIQIISVPSEDEVAKAVGASVAAMPREQIEATLIQAAVQETGMSEAEIAGYMASMSDEELRTAFMQMAAEQYKIQYAEQVRAQVSQMSEAQLSVALDMAVAEYTTEQCAENFDKVIESSDADYEMNLQKLGYVDLDDPASINLYASSFENKEVLETLIADYNGGVDDLHKIAYTDYIGIMMSSVTTIINAITYVLIAFVAVSLVVSSIMIGVITLISVQERTKEIGILRAIGASKKNVSSMFNAETVIIGFASGLLGVLVTYLLCIPINAILHALTGIPNLSARLPLAVGVILVSISVLLTLISGIIPSRSAAKKDPVVALRTE